MPSRGVVIFSQPLAWLTQCWVIFGTRYVKVRLFSVLTANIIKWTLFHVTKTHIQCNHVVLHIKCYKYRISKYPNIRISDSDSYSHSDTWFWIVFRYPIQISIPGSRYSISDFDFDTVSYNRFRYPIAISMSGKNEKIKVLFQDIASLELRSRFYKC